jgi:uncharacterized protein YecT (DUF1311 family)
MKLSAGIFILLAMPILGNAQPTPEDISPSRLQALIDLPLNEAVKQRAMYKVPLKSAYEHQMAMADKDCEAEANEGQQPYNTCIRNSAEQTDKDYATFYNYLQLLCHDQEQLRTLQSSERAWHTFRDEMEKTAQASWSEGSGASGFAGEVHLLLVRNRMRELYKIYG